MGKLPLTGRTSSSAFNGLTMTILLPTDGCQASLISVFAESAAASSTIPSVEVSVLPLSGLVDVLFTVSGFVPLVSKISVSTAGSIVIDPPGSTLNAPFPVGTTYTALFAASYKIRSMPLPFANPSVKIPGSVLKSNPSSTITLGSDPLSSSGSAASSDASSSELSIPCAMMISTGGYGNFSEASSNRFFASILS